MTDGYGRTVNYLRLSVTELCDLRCRYCMPEEGICKKRHEDMLTEEEMLLAVQAAASLGITKVRITGGEPLVKKNILSVCRRISRVSGITQLCMTTNGTGLLKLAQPLREAGVQRLNISLDTLQADKYRYMTRTGNFEDAWQGFLAALDAGFEKIKINAVLLGGFNEDEVPALARLTVKYPVDVRFIEWMPMCESGDFTKETQVSGEKVLLQLKEAVPVEADGGVAKLYRLPGALGNIGLITPVSARFCATCNRIRLSADGMLKPCLHSEEEIPIKGLDYEGMRTEMKRAIAAKPPCHNGLSGQNKSFAGRTMNRIGG